MRRWLQSEMCGRLSGQRYLNRDSEDAQKLFEHAHMVARDHFGPGVVALLPPLLQPVGQAIIDGDAAFVRQLAEAVAAWSVHAEIRQVGWAAGRLQISGTVGLTDHQPDSSPAALEHRFGELVPAMSGPELLAGLRSTTLALGLLSETTGEHWPVPAELNGTGLRSDFTAEIDCGHAANGRPLPDGIWGLEASLRALGFADRQQIQIVNGRLRAAPLLASRPEGRPVAVYVGNQGRLMLRIGGAVPASRGTALASRAARHLPPPVKRVLRPAWRRIHAGLDLHKSNGNRR
jgi:hypothetical protein